MLGISESSVKRHVEGRLLEPIKDDKGWHRFPIDKVEEIRESIEITRVRRMAPSSEGASPARREIEPEIFVSILEHLDAGKHVVDIAKEMKLLPSQLDPVYRWWVEKRGSYLVTMDMAEDIHSHLFLFAKNMQEGQALKKNPGMMIQMLDRLSHRMQILESEAEHRGKCSVCRTAKAMYCPPCAKKRFAEAD